MVEGGKAMYTLIIFFCCLVTLFVVYLATKHKEVLVVLGILVTMVALVVAALAIL